MCASREFWGYQCLVECVSVSNVFPWDICQYLVGTGIWRQGVQNEENPLSHIIIIYWVTDDRWTPGGEHFVWKCGVCMACPWNKYHHWIHLCFNWESEFKSVKVMKRNPPNKIPPTCTHLSPESLEWSFMHCLSTTIGWPTVCSGQNPDQDQSLLSSRGG